MPIDISAHLYTNAWYGLLILVAAYGVIGVALRWHLQRIIRVTRYDPPGGISPTIAAVLVDNGRCERAFATSLVSLAATGYVRIAPTTDVFTIEKAREADANLTPEESVAFASLFPVGAYSYSFREEDSVRLVRGYEDFRSTAMNIVTKEWMSTHAVLWLAGLTCSLLLLEPIAFSTPNFGRGMSFASIGFMGILVIVGISCLLAALQVWPATLAKLISQVSASGRSRRRLNFNDAIPIFLTGPALLGFASLAVLTPRSSRLSPRLQLQ